MQSAIAPAARPVKIADGFWQICGPSLTHPWDANGYLITGDEPVLIDCGSTLGYEALKANLKPFGYGPGDVSRVLATHGHWDHVSAAALLQEDGGARLFIHDADRAQVETGDHDLTASFLYDQRFPPARVDGMLGDGDHLTVNGIRIEVYHTPGHSPGSVCLIVQLQDVRLLVAADTLWAHGHPRIRSDFDVWATSLDRLLELEFDAIVLGHGNSVGLFDGKRRVQEARAQFGVYYSPWFKPFHTTFVY